MELELLRPQAGWFALLALGVLVFAVRASGRRRRAVARLVPQGRSVPARLWSPGRTRVRWICASVALVLGAVALVGPVSGSTEREEVRRGIDVVVCLDTSRSMLARDVRPSRFERAKREIGLLLDELGANRASLVAFGGDARQVAPLSRDGVALRQILDTVTMQDTRVGGTDLGRAIDFALELFEERSGKNEAIVLVTDGEDLTGEGLIAAERAADRGIRVYVVGIGTTQGAKIPISDPGGDERFLTDPDGDEVVSKLVDETLERLALATGGAYTSTERSGRPLLDLFRGPIEEVERVETLGGSSRVPHDRYQWPLLAAILLVTIEGALRERRHSDEDDRR